MNNSKLCSFAHGKDDIIMDKCLNGIGCWKEECNYEHPKDWNPLNNKLECIFCDKGFCNKENTKYKHININEGNKDIILDIPRNEYSPEIIKNKIIKNKTINNENKKLYEYKYSDILKSNLNNCKEKEIKVENNIKKEDTIIDIKKQLEGNYILLSKLDSKNWSDYEEIDNIKDNIKILEDKYNNLKNIDKKDNILDNDLNLNIIFNENNLCNILESNNKTNDSEDIPNVKISINGINIKEDKSNLKVISENNDSKILIKNMEDIFKDYSIKIKKNIKINIKNDYIKIMVINNLNEIESMINLFKNNYEDTFF